MSKPRRSPAGLPLWLAFFLTVSGSQLTALPIHASDHGAKIEDPKAEEVQEAAPTHWTPELMMEVRRVGDVHLSADGERLVYTVRDVVMEPGESQFRNQVYMASTDGSWNRQMTFGESGASQPRLSPDGRWLAFTASRQGRNIYVMDADGGEAWQLTSVETGVGTFIWSKDGRRIVYTAAEGPSDEQTSKTKDKDDGYVVGALRENAHLWIVDLPEKPGKLGEQRRLTEGDFHVNPAYQWGLDISPDGKTVTFARSDHPRANEWVTADLYQVDVESGELNPLKNGTAAESNPRYSPDGKWVAFGISDDPPNWPFTADIAVIPADGSGPHRILAPTFDQNRTTILGWSKESDRIYFRETRGTLTRFGYLPLDGGPAVDVQIGDRVSDSASWASESGRLAFVGESFHEPPEVFVLETASDQDPRQLSAANADIPDLPLPKAEVIRWRSKDGREIEGVLVHPTGEREGPVPLLLNVHGGPTGVYRQSFLASPSFQPMAALAAQGYAVLRPNFRGSSGYGKEFRYANVRDWGGKDYEDLMMGVEHLIQQGYADADRMGVFGWSYGGYMSSWIITQTDRFKAAIIGAPVTNLMSFTGTADIPGFIPNYFGGEHWENPGLYQSRSAMFQIRGAKTPSLILHGENDIRVPIGQSYELHTALKRLGVETQMVAYPRMPHGPREPRQLLDLARRHMAWFERLVLGAGEAE